MQFIADACNNNGTDPTYSIYTLPVLPATARMVVLLRMCIYLSFGKCSRKVRRPRPLILFLLNFYLFKCIIIFFFFGKFHFIFIP